jgi:hypothetical protein
VIRGRQGRRGRETVVAAAMLLVAGVLAWPAQAGPTGTLALHAEIPWQGGDSACPPGTSSTLDCHAHPGGPVLVPGLGNVRQEYLYLVVLEPADADCRARGGFNIADYTAHLVVIGKGQIDLAVKGISDCLFDTPPDTVVNNTQSFTVTGGTGAYAGATGSGTVRHDARRNGEGHAFGTDIWEGSLVVAGREFDLNAPTLTGIANKVVRAARRARTAVVRFKVGANDDVDGTVPTTCKPRSGTRFKLGKTRVSCSATDTSGNRVTAAFTVTVKPRR